MDSASSTHAVFLELTLTFLWIQAGAVQSGFHYAELTNLINLLADEDTPEALGLSPVLQCTLIQNESKSLHSTLSLLEASARSKG
jgi:hypothetical protein